MKKKKIRKQIRKEEKVVPLMKQVMPCGHTAKSVSGKVVVNEAAKANDRLVYDSFVVTYCLTCGNKYEKFDYSWEVSRR